MKKALIYILIISYSTAGICSSIIPINYSFYPISLEEGLLQSTVRAILMDQKGTLWIGTKKGVNAYRQNENTSYTYNREDSLSLSDNMVNCLAEDSLHNIWAGTVTGLSVFSRPLNKFILKANEGIYSAFATNGCIYFGGNNRLFVYNYTQQSIKPINIVSEAISNEQEFRIIDIQPMPDRGLLLCTKEKGIFIYNETKESIESFIEDHIHLPQTACIASDSCIYIPTMSRGLYQYSSEGKLIRHFTQETKGIESNYILDAHEFNGELWIATDGKGIRLLNLKTRELKALEHIPGNPFSLPTNSITKIYETPDHQLWAGTVRKGAFYIKETFIRTYREAPVRNPYGLSEDAIISLYEEDNGLLWIGTDGGGINLFNPDTGKFKHYPSEFGDKISSITRFNDDELLVSVYTKGMSIFNKHTGQYRPFVIVDEEINYKECYYGYVPTACSVGTDKIYIIGEHPWVYTPSIHQFYRMRTANNEIIQTEGLTLAHSNPNFSLLTHRNQVFYVDHITDQASPLFQLNRNTDIVSLAYDNDHTIWVASNMGLGHYNMATKEYKVVHTKLFDSTTLLIYDGKERLWVSAQSSLFSYSIKENKFTQFNRSDGFIPNEILFACQNSPQKRFIYLGGNNGLVQIDNSVSQKQIEAPSIILDEIHLDGKSATAGIHRKKLVIPYNYNSLVLNFQIINNDIFQRNLIRFSIEKDGIPLEIEGYNTRLTMPTTLSPGTYRIKAACFAKTGELPQPQHLISIVVRPPWYRTNWFVLITLLCIVSIVLSIAYVSYRVKAKKIRRKMYQYKQHVNEEKINFLININHELRTPLTLIYTPLKRIIDKGQDSYKDTHNYYQLQLIYKQAKRMYSIINMLLDMNRLESGYQEMKMAAHNINQWVRNTADDFLNEANGKHITIRYEFDSSLTDLWFDEWKCQIILSNLLMNAIKFSTVNSHITISTLHQDNGFVRISVSDEGIGLSDDDLSHVFERHYEGAHTQKGSGIGLAYSKMLAELHGGTMGCYNNTSKGATFFYQLPLSQHSSPVSEENSPFINESNLMKHEIKVNTKDFTILIVEDTDDLRHYLSDAFKERFKEVYNATNGEEALQLCYDKDPDLVVSDIMMPVMNGFELCSHIKTDPRISHIQVLLLTARNQEQDEQLGYKLGADFYVKKPFDMEFLQTVLTSMLSRRQQYIKEQFADFLPSPQDVTTSTGDEQFLCKLNDIINENISNEDLNITFICEQIGMGRTSLYKKMSKVTGMGVNDYINRIRIEKSEHYLLHTELSIKEISQELGFAYPRYFSTTFKQFKGLTPTQFKEQNKK